VATRRDPIVEPAGALAGRYAATRALTADLAAPLSDADATIQPFPDASPSKWHLAHTTWFFETFVLRDHMPGYRCFDERYGFLFNSYYEGEGERHPRPKRGMLSRPSLDEVRSYRAYVDDALLSTLPRLSQAVLDLVELGINHEQQHQELFLTDILATFAANPLELAYRQSSPGFSGEGGRPKDGGGAWLTGRTGIIEIGASPTGFAFDCERPRHRLFLHPHKLAARPVTNADWDAFTADGGYKTPARWLSEGWDWVSR
jgi:ergothioneine biosynthesis protein EgtB